MTFEDSLLDAEAAHHNCFIAESKFKNAGKGLFAKTCMGLYSVPPHTTTEGKCNLHFHFLCVFFFFSVLPKDTLIPYCGVLCLHEVNPQDTTVPITLLPGVEAGWNRIVELGHQPVVLEDGRVVRKFYDFTFAIAMKMLPIV